MTFYGQRRTGSPRAHCYSSFRQAPISHWSSLEVEIPRPERCEQLMSRMSLVEQASVLHAIVLRAIVGQVPVQRRASHGIHGTRSRRVVIEERLRLLRYQQGWP
ncbi:hypothetical protein BDV96DRAFT_25811 [Lophiotrema nucula]|uniref:Uncharacterized protein n=1 Tax=Lophiotrema nucula TaxID=690887 RepID=A0A6A5ZD31_9PLEO|nr:hypothetical protein BDV96DRAFT_25811 [Lophiotrema nucula]